GGHDHQRVIGFQHAMDYVPLYRQKLRKTESAFQLFERLLTRNLSWRGLLRRRRVCCCSNKHWLSSNLAGERKPTGQLHEAAQLLVRFIHGPPPMSKRNPEQRSGSDFGHRLLKTNKGESASAVGGRVAIANPFSF